jgi:hypothetical protein
MTWLYNIFSARVSGLLSAFRTCLRFWRRSVYGGVIEVQSFSTVAKVAYNLRGNETILLTRGSIDGELKSYVHIHSSFILKFTRAASNFVLASALHVHNIIPQLERDRCFFSSCWRLPSVFALPQSRDGVLDCAYLIWSWSRGIEIIKVYPSIDWVV